MKIAHVTATYLPYRGGTGNVVLHNARLMHERGHQVTVLTGQNPGPNPPPSAFPVRYLKSPIRIGNAPISPSLLTYLRGFDVIHLHCPFMVGAELTTMAAAVSKTPMVITYHHDLIAPGLRGAAFAIYVPVNKRVVLRRAAALLFTSRDYGTASYAHDLAVHGVPVDEMPNGVDTSVFRPGENDTAEGAELGVPEDAPFVLFVGGLDRAHYFKGVATLIEAVKRLPALHLVVVGTGDMQPEFETQSDSIQDRVHFVGSRTSDQLVSLYRAARATVLPSTSRGEAFGIVLLESLACATPVVASNLPGVRTVVANGVDGFLVPPADVEGLADALDRVSDPEVSRHMGTLGAERVERQFGWAVIGNRLESVYADVVRQHRAIRRESSGT